MTKALRRTLMTMAVLTLAVGLAAMFALSGCGSDGGSSDLVGPAEDAVILPGGVSAAKLDASAEKIPFDPNIAGINLGDNGHFYSLSVARNYVDNHWFMTKTNVSYQVEVVAEGTDMDVDLYLGRSSHPYTGGAWKSSTRDYPLMDGIVFKSAEDGIMYVDVRGADDGVKFLPSIPYHIHVRKCQFGTFNQ